MKVGAPLYCLAALMAHAVTAGPSWEQLTFARSTTPRGKAALPPAIEGVSFADAPGTLHAPARELGEALGLGVQWDSNEERVLLGGRAVPDDQVRRLPDGTRLLALRSLEDWNGSVSWDAETALATVRRAGQEVRVRWGEKRVAINLDAQRMRAWQGERTVLDTRISSGRPGMETPKGYFEAGPLKRPMLISRKYGNARMPWSVQIRGDIVIHGFSSVPPRAASHGCVRVPLTGVNPARWFYRWVDTGTPIRVADGWPSPSSSG